MLFKILNRMNIRSALILILSTILNLPVNSQPLKIIKSPEEYRERILDDSLQQMVELNGFIPGIQYDLRYGSPRNFTGQRLYSQSKLTYLRILPAQALMRVEEELRKKGMGLKIFDAYRPYSVTVKMWELIKDDRYVADPVKGSGHNRGLAVDLTIISLASKKELEMGTGFDNFSDTAHQSFTNLPVKILKNRMLLRTLLEQNGFKALETEWWHYYWPNNRDYDVLDLDFKDLSLPAK
ncbi:MAG: peptidase M15 [Terrimonas sp.]|nr:peptidase M15 [Terrimonas sp.]